MQHAETGGGLDGNTPCISSTSSAPRRYRTAKRARQSVELGEWEFEQLVLHAVLKKGELEVEEGHTRTSGVEWELLGAKLPPPDSRSGLRIDFRARQAEDTPRSRALIGLLPRANPDASGWRNYRVSGSLASPRVGTVD